MYGKTYQEPVHQPPRGRAAERRSRYSQVVLPALSVDEFALLNFFGATPVQSAVAQFHQLERNGPYESV